MSPVSASDLRRVRFSLESGESIYSLCVTSKSPTERREKTGRRLRERRGRDEGWKAGRQASTTRAIALSSPSPSSPLLSPPRLVSSRFVSPHLVSHVRISRVYHANLSRFFESGFFEVSPTTKRPELIAADNSCSRRGCRFPGWIALQVGFAKDRIDRRD